MPDCKHNYFGTVTPDRCPGLVMIATAEEKESRFACPGFQLYFVYTAADKRALAKTFQIVRVSISAFLVNVGHSHKHHWGSDGKRSPICAIMNSSYRLMKFLKTLFLLRLVRLLSISSVRPIQRIMTMMLSELWATRVCKITDIVHYSSTSLSTNLYV